MSADRKIKLSSVESSILDYVLNLHCSRTDCKRSAYLSLLCHACLLARGARLVDNDKLKDISVLPDNWAASDPIRITYRFQSDSKGSPTSSGHGTSDQLVNFVASFNAYKKEFSSSGLMFCSCSFLQLKPTIMFSLT